ncbi:hypothetical protein [Acinetobacter sp.]|uniref:hypothetical protein n=1 Tax=Acinetobacter sp. TaxID=472 RepID=UPI00258FA407|nr:hypothetical protein [Acinetobacter sp.]
MSEFHKEVGTLFGLTELQSAQMEQGLSQLAQEFSAAAQVDDQAFSASFYQKFEQLALASGLSEADIEALVNVLYFHEAQQAVATYIVPSYYNAGGDRERFSDTYQLMMEEMQQAI